MENITYDRIDETIYKIGLKDIEGKLFYIEVPVELWVYVELLEIFIKDMDTEYDFLNMIRVFNNEE